jgi:hypothetical protein
MKRTNKHVKETAKPAQQPAFKTPAQRLEEFKAKVLAMRYGEYLWMILDSATNREISRLIGTTIRLEEFPAAFREATSRVPELWPEYLRLLRLNPDALKAYQYRAAWNGTWGWRLSDRGVPHVVDVLRRTRGRPRKLADRDAKIVHMHDVGKYSFGKIARKLKIYDKHGAPSGATAYSAYRRYKPKTETEFPLNSDTET